MTKATQKKSTQNSITKVLAPIGRAIGEATGIGPIARAAVDAEDGLIDRLVAKAREHKISEKRITEALKLKGKYDRAMSVIALLYPIFPNPALLRLVAGRPERQTRAAKAPAAKGRPELPPTHTHNKRGPGRSSSACAKNS